jgi:hypothetical protein
MVDLALESPYRTTTPNQTLLIYSGEMIIKQDLTVVKGQGSLELRWLPNPRLTFSLRTKDFSTHEICHGDAQLIYSSKERYREVPICIQNIVRSDTHSLGGRAYPIEFKDKEADLSSVTFHVTNFIGYRGKNIQRLQGSIINNWLGPIELETQEWIILVDKVQNFDNLNKQLRLEGGYAVTHICQLKRPSDQTFTTKRSTRIFVEPSILSIIRQRIVVSAHFDSGF